MNPYRLDDKVVLITGAARGQGAAEVDVIAELGARMVAFLVSDAAGPCTGAEFVVDGGATA